MGKRDELPEARHPATRGFPALAQARMTVRRNYAKEIAWWTAAVVLLIVCVVVCASLLGQYGNEAVTASSMVLFFSLVFVFFWLGDKLFPRKPYSRLVPDNERLNIILAEHLGWTWEDAPVPPSRYRSTLDEDHCGRFTGTIGGLTFELDTQPERRVLRIPLPSDVGPDFGPARDFTDLLRTQALLENWESGDELEATTDKLRRRAALGLGRDRESVVEDGELIITAKPYIEKGQSRTTRIRRRMREAEAVLTLIDALNEDIRELRS